MNRRMVKQECYLDMLEEAINSVESVLNYIDRIKDKVGVFNDDILQKDALEHPLIKNTHKIKLNIFFII